MDGGAARAQRASHEEAATAADVMPGAGGVERPEMLYPAGDRLWRMIQGRLVNCGLECML